MTRTEYTSYHMISYLHPANSHPVASTDRTHTLVASFHSHMTPSQLALAVAVAIPKVATLRGKIAHLTQRIDATQQQL